MAILLPEPDQTGPFAVGTHTIIWSATDNAGNTGTANQTVTITDTTPPIIIAPDDITLEATGPTTNVELGIVNATDIVDGLFWHHPVISDLSL